MGTQLVDNFSILHGASGVVLYFWGFSLFQTTLIHTVFEILENTKTVMKWTNSTGWWPGGKPQADNLTNMTGDTIFCMLGWIISYIIDKRYNRDVQVRGKLI
jgi:hypothetical protein